VKANFVDKRIDGIAKVTELQLMFEAYSHENLISYEEISIDCPLDVKIEPPNERRGSYRPNRTDNLYFVMKKADFTLDDMIFQHKPRLIAHHQPLSTNSLRLSQNLSS